MYYLAVFQNVKLWGLPNGNIGWANEPFDIIEAITAFELEQREIEQERIEKSAPKKDVKNKR